jgi:S1-C subfamily serine protease
MWLSINSGPEAGKGAEVSGQRFVIGRDEHCNLVLTDGKASRNHAFLEVQPTGQVILHDMGSTNGTYVNERRVDQPTPLFGGEQVRIGDTVLVLSGATAPAPTRAEPVPAPVGYGAPTRAEPVPPAPGPPQVPAPVPAFGQAPPPVPQVRPRRMGTATIERLVLRSGRNVRRATILAGIAIVVAIAVVALFLFGPLKAKTTTAPPTVAEIVKAITPSTVLVINEANGQRQASGTGWVYDRSRGLIVTNDHVVEGGTSFEVGVGNKLQPATLVGTAACRDLAVLKIKNTNGLKTLPLGSQSDLALGDAVVALGFPANASLQDKLVATSGTVSVVRTNLSKRFQTENGAQYPDLVQSDAAINPGNSGGPLVDEDENLVGVNTLVVTQIGTEKLQNQNYAIGVDLVKQVVPKLAQGNTDVCSATG